MTQSFGDQNKENQQATTQQQPAGTAEVRHRSAISRSFTRDPAEEAPGKFAKAMQKAIEAQGPRAAEFRVVIVPTSEGIRLPIVALARTIGSTTYTFGYVLWNNQPIPDYIEPNTQERIPRTANDVCDKLTADRLKDRVQREMGIGGANARIIVAGLTPISTEVSPENDEQVADLLFVAGNAIETAAEHNKDLAADPITLATLRDAQGRLEARASYGNGNGVTMVGLPNREDIRVELVQTLGKNNPNSLHNSDQTLSVLSGYMDFAYAPREMIAQQYHMASQAVQFPGQAAPKLNRRFIGTFVITNTDYMAGGVTLESKLFALASLSALLRAPYQWVESFRNQYASHNPLRNLGGLAREVPQLTDPKAGPNAVAPGKAVDTFAANFKREDLYALAEELVFPDIAVAYDVDEGGPWAWLEGILLDAAGVHDRGGDVSRSARATKMIIRAMDNITGNRFSANFNAGSRIFQPVVFRMHRGYFELKDHGRMDIRELGMLELLNSDTGKQSYANALRYVSTFEDMNMPEHVAQRERLSVHQDTLGGGQQLVKVVSHTRRLIFSGEFLTAMLKSFIGAGLSFTADQIHTTSGTQQRGAQYLNGAIIASNLGLGMVHAPGTTGPAGVSYQAPQSVSGLFLN